MNKLILLDSNSLIYRAFHALPPLTNSKGQNTGAVFGFVNMLTGLIEQEKPTHIAAAFDLKAPTFRHTMFDGYKATRKPMPDELAEQLPYVKRILSSMKIKILELEGFEADDILGTVAKRFACPTLIVSGDRDCLQLVSESTHVYLTKKGIKDVEVYSLARLKEDGFTPLSFIDFKALKGDASDNIPGIAGIGDVTAKNLIAQYGSLEKVLESADELKGKLAEKIKAGRESAILSKKLATIVTDAPLKLTLDDLRCEYPYPDEFREALSELEFGSVVKRLEFRTQDAVPSDCDMPAADEITVEDENELIKVLRSLKGDIALTAGEDIHLSDGRYEYVLRAGGDLFSGMTSPLLLLTVGVAFTAVIQSSSAVTGIVITLAQLGIMPVTATFYIIMGSNVGSCATAMLAAIGGSLNARRTAMIHLLFNAIGVILFLPFVIIFGEKTVDALNVFSPSVIIAYFHIAFNLVTTLVLLPFVKALANLACLMVGDKQTNACNKDKNVVQ